MLQLLLLLCAAALLSNTQRLWPRRLRQLAAAVASHMVRVFRASGAGGPWLWQLLDGAGALEPHLISYYSIVVVLLIHAAPTILICTLLAWLFSFGSFCCSLGCRLFLCSPSCPVHIKVCHCKKKRRKWYGVSCSFGWGIQSGDKARLITLRRVKLQTVVETISESATKSL